MRALSLERRPEADGAAFAARACREPSGSGAATGRARRRVRACAGRRRRSAACAPRKRRSCRDGVRLGNGVGIGEQHEVAHGLGDAAVRVGGETMRPVVHEHADRRRDVVDAARHVRDQDELVHLRKRAPAAIRAARARRRATRRPPTRASLREHLQVGRDRAARALLPGEAGVRARCRLSSARRPRRAPAARQRRARPRPHTRQRRRRPRAGQARPSQRRAFRTPSPRARAARSPRSATAARGTRRDGRDPQAEACRRSRADVHRGVRARARAPAPSPARRRRAAAPPPRQHPRRQAGSSVAGLRRRRGGSRRAGLRE